MRSDNVCKATMSSDSDDGIFIETHNHLTINENYKKYSIVAKIVNISLPMVFGNYTENVTNLCNEIRDFLISLHN